MRRFFSAVTKWDTMTVLQLRDELARRGLKRAGTKSDLIERLLVSETEPPAPKAPERKQQQAEALPSLGKLREIVGKTHAELKKPAVPPPPVTDSVPELHLNNLPTQYLLAEIAKRRPKEAVSPNASKNELIGLLEAVVLQEKVNPWGVKDIRTLMMRMNLSPKEVAVTDVLNVLKGIINVETIPQNDLNVLVMSENSSFFRMWSLLYSSVPALPPSSLVTVLHTMHLFRFTLKKTFSTGDVNEDTSGMRAICEKLTNCQQEMTVKDLASAIELLLQHNQVTVVSDTIRTLQANLLLRLDQDVGVAQLTPLELFSVFWCLPNDAYSKKRDAVDRIIRTLFDNRGVSWTHDRAVQAANKLHSLSCPVPTRLQLLLSFTPKEYLRQYTFKLLLSFTRTLCEQRCFSERITRIITEM